MGHMANNPATYLVAHRGDRAGGVENTLAAFVHAARAGARFAECDIQFTCELIPVVLHDNTLGRLCDREDLCVGDTDLSALTVACSPRFELLTLKALLQWLRKQPQLTLFVEVKPDILHRLSPTVVADLLAEALPADQLQQLVVISESGPIIDACKTQLGCRTGWVSETAHQPESVIDYVFMPYSRTAEIEAWHARGVKVGLYTINSPDLASALLAQHADLVETDHFTHMSALLA
ncbi:glycerophosphodiester phosphodiesterase [Mariprofundus ferrooxydans]|uniref:Glycerophosphoryl diester phosphodiesterase n=2 Tax=Mariprofundus ferrooxydans TaxID=314344 RepID=Q0F038_9PROT|nr:glycerophosphodiester phosphodiesterase family protein [Mariprofundus ferrooxydans]EAU54846.1 Glycerophosphoryl diester phosphodiesterase [Mariprofundus ferrooxydans PV-1]KON46358.1 glycerophosphodiester phosphodiesterase [Mariprofundus ferrooxydans]